MKDTIELRLGKHLIEGILVVDVQPLEGKQRISKVVLNIRLDV
jgi:hypothetical protein